MEVLGYTYNRPFKERNGQWIELEYKDEDAFLEGTNKVLRATNSDGRGYVLHAREKYTTEINFVSYDTENRLIKVYARQCQKLTTERQ